MQVVSSTSDGHRRAMRGLLLAILGAGTLLLGACAGDEPAPSSAKRATSATAHHPDQHDQHTPAPAQTPEQQAPKDYPPGTCGTVKAASGKTLQVQRPDGGQPGCDEANRVVTEFHRRIAGQQPAGSDQPMGMQVDGWQCVSGPPTAQGGTTCTKQGSELTIGAKMLP